MERGQDRAQVSQPPAGKGAGKKPAEIGVRGFCLLGSHQSLLQQEMEALASLLQRRSLPNAPPTATVPFKWHVSRALCRPVSVVWCGWG